MAGKLRQIGKSAKSWVSGSRQFHQRMEDAQQYGIHPLQAIGSAGSQMGTGGLNLQQVLGAAGQAKNLFRNQRNHEIDMIWEAAKAKAVSDRLESQNKDADMSDAKLVFSELGTEIGDATAKALDPSGKMRSAARERLRNLKSIREEVGTYYDAARGADEGGGIRQRAREFFHPENRRNRVNRRRRNRFGARAYGQSYGEPY